MSDPGSVDLGAVCPGCGEPWLRTTNLPGRYRCVNCLRRFELLSVCPNCGEHSTIVRMSSTDLYQCNHCRELDAPADLMAGFAGVAPSILSADFARLGAQVEEVLAAGAHTIHVDVMDGHFVPPITMGPLVVQALADTVHDAGGVIDVHLMVARPERHVADFARAGADGITVHVEATPHIHYALQAVRNAGCRAGLALNPGTPADAVAELAGDVDLVLCMTVNPGWGGQEFLAHSLGKVERLQALVGAGPVIEVDGGVDATTAGPCAQAGATLFVAGTAVFGAQDPGAAVRRIQAAVANAENQVRPTV